MTNSKRSLPQDAEKQTETKERMKHGVVTFLDVLGWKGIWLRDKINPLHQMNDLTQVLIDRRNAWEKEKNLWEKPRTKIIGISDTIAIFTHAPKNPEKIPDVDGQPVFSTEIEALELHGLLSQDAIIRSITFGIPVRGATSTGEFYLEESRYYGPAIDEAAEWFESTDWIGVHLTPSAWLGVDEVDLSESWIRCSPPFKKMTKWETYCVDWPKSWKTSIESKERRMQLKTELNIIPTISPDIAGKFSNTIAFFDERMKESLPDKQASHDGVTRDKTPPDLAAHDQLN